METNIDDILLESRPTMFEKRKGSRLNLYRTTEDACEWITELYDECFGGMGRRNIKREKAFRMILVNFATIKGAPLVIPLHRSSWKDVEPFPDEMSIRGITGTVLALEQHGYVEVKRGYKTDEASAPTIVLPTDSLQARLPDSFNAYIQKEGLIRRDDFKGDSNHSKSVHKQIREYVLQLYNTRMADNPAVQLFSICKEDYSSYGRLHGSVLQSVPKQQRQQLIVDGGPTFEIDIKSCLPFIALAMKSVDYSGDIYRVPGIPRAVMKKAVLIGLNSDTKTKARRGLQSYLNQSGGSLPDGSPADAKMLYDSLEYEHPILKELLYQDLGLYLMHVESTHMLMFLQRMCLCGIPVFPIHDSVIARVCDKGIVVKSFVETFTINGVKPKVSIEHNLPVTSSVAQ